MHRVIVITGASKGLGFKLTEDFIKAGDTVHTLSRTTASLQKLARTITSHGNLNIHKVDVTSEHQIKNFIALLKKKRIKVDILINNAGYGGGLARVEDTSAAEFLKFQDANLKSAFLMCKYFIPLFRKWEKGLILNISSMAGKRGVPRLFAYSASKFGMQALTECIAKENEDLPHFKCLTICPGGMNTSMRSKMFGKKDAEHQQSTSFVASIIGDVAENRIPLNTGSDIVIRHSKVAAIHPLPGA